MPAWHTLGDCADYYRCSVPVLLYACAHGMGDWYVRRWRAVQQIEMACLAAAHAREAPPPGPHLPAGFAFFGGPTDPRYSGSFADEGDDPAVAA